MEDEYRKIPKISPFKYKPPKLATQNTLRLIAPPNISPPPLGACTWKRRIRIQWNLDKIITKGLGKGLAIIFVVTRVRCFEILRFFSILYYYWSVIPRTSSHGKSSIKSPWGGGGYFFQTHLKEEYRGSFHCVNKQKVAKPSENAQLQKILNTKPCLQLSRYTKRRS